MLEDIRLKTNTVVSVLLNVSEPECDSFRMSVLDLNKSSAGYTLEVLLTLLVHEIASGDCPSLCDFRKRHGALCREVQVVGCAQTEVGEDLEVAHAVRAQLEVGNGDSVGWCALEGREESGLDGFGEAELAQFGAQGGFRGARGGGATGLLCGLLGGLGGCRRLG